MLPFLLRNLPRGPIQRIAHFLENPERVQEELLRGLLTKAADTEWGRRFDFAAIAKSDDVVRAYQAAVPLHNYEALRGDVDRIRAGTPDVFWPGRFTDFAVSSGTASAGKIIPVSSEMLTKNRHFSMGLMFNYVERKGSASLLFGKYLALPGRIEEDPAFPGTFIGEVSGLQNRYAPAIVAKYYQAVSDDVLNEPSWDVKLDKIVAATVNMDIRSVVMVPTWALVLFEKLIKLKREQDGKAETLLDVWPNFKVYFSGGVALNSYRPLLEEQISGSRDDGASSVDVDFVEAYGASEGFIAFQLNPTDRDMAIHLDNGVFFEFVKMEDLGGAFVGGASTTEPGAVRRYTIGEVEPNVRYALFVTTCSGLWSYQIGDVVRFTSTNPYKLLVAGRTSEMIDKYGEAVFGEEAREALKRACAAAGAHARDFHVAPSAPDRDRLPRHQWLIEFDREPADTASFAEAIDAYLQEVNRHYFIRRDAQAFDAPEIVSLPKGLFYKWLSVEKKSVSAQSKVPRMSEERRIADSLLKLIAETGS